MLEDLNIEIKGVTKTVLEYLRNRIVTGELLPGQRLNERQLTSDFGISRAPLREAFRLLENENLVVSRPRRGAYVTELTKGDFLQVYQVREMIECFAIDLLKSRNIKHLPEALSNPTLAVTPSPPLTSSPEEKLAYINLNANFHVSLIQATGNSWLLRFYQTISATLTRCQFMYAFTPGMSKRAAEDHQQLRDCFRVGDYEEAKRLMKIHINHFLKVLLKKSDMGGHHPNKVLLRDNRDLWES